MKNLREIKFELRGEPVAKGRARARLIKAKDGRQFISHYTPKKTQSYESLMQGAAIEAMKQSAIRTPFDGPVQITIRAIFRPADSWPTWKRELALSGRIEHTTKPDKDNIEKAVKDALNGVVYLDDCYVSRGGTIKEYGPVSMVVVTVKERDAYPSQIKQRPAA